MIREGYRPVRPGQPTDVGDAVADLLFVLLSVADCYEVDVEHAYKAMVAKTRARLGTAPPGGP